MLALPAWAVDEREAGEQAGLSAARDAAWSWLSTGVFARRSRLSPKALRLYDRLGLLAPARIDRETGYRGYRESQLATARLIAMLRRLDMPLAQIAAVMAASGPQGAMIIADYWATVEGRIAAQRTLATHLQDSLSGADGDSSMFEFHQREVAEQTVLTEQRHVPVSELSDFIEAALMAVTHVIGLSASRSPVHGASAACHDPLKFATAINPAAASPPRSPVTTQR